MIKRSKLDGETLVVVIEPGDRGTVVDYMDERENGFAVMGEDVPIPMAVVDGRLLEEDWCTPDHLLAIEAHEVGHIRTGSTEEPVAETEGIRLLRAAGHTGAVELLLDRGIVVED